MTAAILGLVGVFLGAVMAQAGTIISDRRQVRSEAARWRRDQKVAAYDGAIRYLLRFANRRSTVGAEGGAFIAKEHIRETIDDLVEAQFWLHTLAARCGPNQVQRIREAAALIDKGIQQLHSGDAFRAAKGSLSSPVWHIPKIVETITDCAREDVSAAKEQPR